MPKVHVAADFWGTLLMGMGTWRRRLGQIRISTLCGIGADTHRVYAQALTLAKRVAHLRLVGLIHLAAETANDPLWSHAEHAVGVSS